MIAQLSLRRCTPTAARFIRSPAALALHRSISLNSGIQRGLLAEKRVRSPTRRGGEKERGSRFTRESDDLPDRGPRRDDADRSRGRTRPSFGASKFGKSDRPSYESRGRSKPSFSSSSRFEKSDRPSFDRESRGRPKPGFSSSRFEKSDRPSYNSSKFEEVDPRFQSGAKPGKWERAAMQAGAGREDWRDVRAVHVPGTGPTKRYSKPSEIWNKYKPQEVNEDGENDNNHEIGSRAREPEGRRSSVGKRPNRRLEKKEDRKSPRSRIFDLENDSAVPELDEPTYRPRRTEEFSPRESYRSDRSEKPYEQRGSGRDLRDRSDRRTGPPGTYPDRNGYEKKAYESLGRTREDKRNFNKKLAERSGRTSDRPSKYAREEPNEDLEELEEAEEAELEREIPAGKSSYVSKNENEDVSRDSPREKRRAEVDADEVPSRIRLTSATSELIFGRNSVMSVLRSKRRKIFKLYVHERLFPDTKGGEELYWELGRLASDAGVDVIEVGDEWLPLFERTCQGKAHNVSHSTPGPN
jgi:hypothetical protein